MNPKDNAVVLYQTSDGATSLAVHLEKKTVWLTQKQMADLFSKDVRTVNEHLRNIFREDELDESSVTRKFRITAADGSKRLADNALVALTLLIAESKPDEKDISLR